MCYLWRTRLKLHTLTWPTSIDTSLLTLLHIIAHFRHAQLTRGIGDIGTLLKVLLCPLRVAAQLQFPVIIPGKASVSSGTFITATIDACFDHSGHALGAGGWFQTLVASIVLTRDTIIPVRVHGIALTLNPLLCFE